MGFIGLGFDPKHSFEQIPMMPKGRYALMRAYMPTVGSMGLDMMFRTCTVQVRRSRARGSSRQTCWESDRHTALALRFTHSSVCMSQGKRGQAVDRPFSQPLQCMHERGVGARLHACGVA